MKHAGPWQQQRRLEILGWLQCRGPQPLGTWQQLGQALHAAGDAAELRCTEEEFYFAFENIARDLSSSSVSVRSAVIVVVFFLEASGEAHLQSISGAGVWLGRLHPGLQTEPGVGGGEGRPFGWDQSADPWRRAPATALGPPPAWPGLRAEGMDLCPVQLRAIVHGVSKSWTRLSD